MYPQCKVAYSAYSAGVGWTLVQRPQKSHKMVFACAYVHTPKRKSLKSTSKFWQKHCQHRDKLHRHAQSHTTLDLQLYKLSQSTQELRKIKLAAGTVLF